MHFIRRIWLKLRNDRVALGAALALGLKVSGSALAIVMFTLAARLMGPERFGGFAVLFNILSFTAVVAVMGQESLIIRNWSEYLAAQRPGLARGALLFGWRVTSTAALIFAFLLFVAWKLGWLKADDSTLPFALAFLIGQSLLLYSCITTRLISGFVYSETGREIFWRLLLVLVMAGCALARIDVTPTQFFSVAVLGMSLAIVLQVRVTKRDEYRLAGDAPRHYDFRQWLGRMRGMWPSAILEAASQYIDVILIGYLVSPLLAGGYFVAMRIANVFSMIASGMNNYTSSRIGALYFGGKRDELQALFNKLNLISALMTVAIVMALVVFGREVLGIFGAGYRDEYPVLMVLTFSVGLFTLGGSAAAVLLTTGHELAYSRIVFFGLLVRMGLFVALVGPFGAMGAAMAWSCANVPMMAILVRQCRQMAGVDPSLLGLILPPKAVQAPDFPASTITRS